MTTLPVSGVASVDAMPMAALEMPSIATAWESTVAEQRARNPHVKDGTTEEEFVAMREARDAKLAPPALLVPSIQVNMRAGRFPPAESNGVRYLRIPVRMREGSAAPPTP